MVVGGVHIDVADGGEVSIKRVRNDSDESNIESRADQSEGLQSRAEEPSTVSRTPTVYGGEQKGKGRVSVVRSGGNGGDWM